MPASQEQTWTVEQYLELERTSEVKHEYLDGYIYAMTGASANHNVIAVNTAARLHAQLRQRPCTVFPGDQRVKADRLYAYPDISVVCSTPQYTDESPRTLLNPTAIVEVLSPTTEKFDRGAKSWHYRELDSLQEYLLTAQDRYHIEHYVLQPDGAWLLKDAVGLEARQELTSIGCTLALADV
jgi:Uma2 family endonuclease